MVSPGWMTDDQRSPFHARTSAVRRPYCAAMAVMVWPGRTVCVVGFAAVATWAAGFEVVARSGAGCAAAACGSGRPTLEGSAANAGSALSESAADPTTAVGIVISARVVRVVGRTGFPHLVTRQP